MAYFAKLLEDEKRRSRMPAITEVYYLGPIAFVISHWKTADEEIEYRIEYDAKRNLQIAPANRYKSEVNLQLACKY